MKKEILSMLRSAEGYVSGQQLCDRLKVSRTAVWKVIEQLKSEGYDIEAVHGKGYHLVSVPDVISQAEIESRLQTKWVGCSVFYCPVIDSTNTKAKRLADEGAPHGTLVAAGHQSAGKGRRGRVWESPEGTGIYMTLLLRPELKPEQAPMLTVLMAQSVADAIQTVTGITPGIKWPNDIVMDGRKVCGILTEMSTEMTWIHYVVIGVGINVHQQTFPEELKDKASSLDLAGAKSVKWAELVAEVMRNFEIYYEQFEKEGDLSVIWERYNEMLVNRDREVRVLEPGHEYNGHALGIDKNGELLVRRENGQVETIYAGEVSVRGIYGYV